MDTSEALDLSKENIQPLKQGRNAVKLGAALQAQTNSEVQQQLVKEREKFELMIRMYEGDDPLQPRYEYVSWIEQCYPKHGPDSNLVPLLEDTLTTFKDDDKYKQDPRFVELLVKYFDTQSNPLELYQLVYNQGLGTMCALFYRAWADEFDKNNDMMRADQIYQLGIKNRAQPLDQLTEVHKQFQLSVGRRTLGYMDNYEEVDAYSREALSRQNKKKIPSIRETNRAPGTWRLGSTNVLGQNQIVKPNVKVYQDDSSDDNFPGHMIAGVSGVFPTHNNVQKENSTLKPGPWTGPGHKVKHVPKPPTTPTFQVHEDEGVEGVHHPHTVVPRALKTKKQDTFTCPLAVFEPPDPTKKAMYCKHKVYIGNTEFQFEELRAAAYWKQMEQQKIKKEIEFQTSPDRECYKEENLTCEDKESNNVQQQSQEVADNQDNATVGTHREALCTQRVHGSEMEVHRRDLDLPVEPPDEASNEPLAVTDESQSVHSVFSNKRIPIQKFGNKPMIDANASLTVNTKEAMNFVQEMWGSPSPLQVPAKQRKTFGSFKSSASKLDDNVFKVPTVPQAKIPPFALYTDEEPAPSGPEILATEINQKFSVFVDDGDNEKIVETKSDNHKKSSTFKVYSDNVEKEEFRCSSFGLPGENTRKELDNIESCETNDPVFQSKPLLGLMAESIQPSDPKDFVLRSTNNKKETTTSKSLLYEDQSKHFVKTGQNSKEPVMRSIVAHTPPRSHILDSKQQPQFNKFPFNVEDNDGDFTSNTKAFAFALPSSTPMSGHFQNAVAGIQETNMSFTTEALPPKSVVGIPHQPELSLILEASKEKGSSSSSNGATCPESDSSEGKQKLISQDIAEMEKSIGVLNLTGEINPFSSELISQLLSHVGYPRPCHLARVYHIDRDLSNLIVHSTAKMGPMTYAIQGEIGKGAYARILKATRDDKPVALKFQKPGCVWELYIAQELQLRLKKVNSNVIAGFMESTNAFIFRNATVFETEWAVYGSLLNVVNIFKAETGKNIPVDVVTLLSKQLLSIVEHLHKCKIIHGDIKPDNFLLTSLPSLDSQQQLCVNLIDYGRSIDMSLFPAGTSFTTVVSTDGFTCTEMLDKLPWTYQIDTFGLAGTIYLLLMGDYMKVVKKNNKWRLQFPIPRYLQKSLWEPIFDTLLNVESCDKQADLLEIETSLGKHLESISSYNLKQNINTFNNALNGR